jgi:protein import protein ZIM17
LKAKRKQLRYRSFIRHLIADHLGWFKESMQNGKLRTIEDLLKAQGEKVRGKGKLDLDGMVEYVE